MRNYKKPLEEAYFSALAGITYNTLPVPVFTDQKPDDENPDNYIIIRDVTAFDSSNKTNNQVTASINVEIYTRAQKYNDGLAENDIADQVYSIIYPNPQAKLVLSGNFYMVSTELANDNNPQRTEGIMQYSNRVLMFRHKIYMR